jgi:hypothetical protein
MVRTVTDAPLTAEVIRPEQFKPRPRLVHDCQSEGHLTSALKGSVQILNPGMDFAELLAVQAKEREQKRDAELFKEWKDVTEALFKGSKRYPFDHAMIFLKDMKGRRP